MQFKVLCLMGPTAAGKTDLAFKISELFPCEIVSVDSAMIYQGMDIGTAKPTLNERKLVLHHLIDIVPPEMTYSAVKFQEDATLAIKAIQAKRKLPILVGGTMLYFRALQQGLSILPPADIKIRQRLSIEAKELGWQRLHVRLAQVDPVSAARINVSDPQRIQRALEVYEITGKALSELWQKQSNRPSNRFKYLNIAIAPLERRLLHQRIVTRFKQMLQNGFIDEVATLHARKTLHINLPSMRSVGYRQAWQYLEGQFTYNDFYEKGLVATRQLAKRQLTWLRHWKELTWFESDDKQVFEKIERFLKQEIYF